MVLHAQFIQIWTSCISQGSHFYFLHSPFLLGKSEKSLESVGYLQLTLPEADGSLGEVQFISSALLLARVTTRSSCSADSRCGLHFCYTSSILKLKLLTGALYSGYHSVFLMIFFLIPVKCYSSISVTMIRSECCYVILM